MTIPNVDTNEEKLVFITIVFPYESMELLTIVKGNLDKALGDLPKVKTELRMTEVRS